MVLGAMHCRGNRRALAYGALLVTARSAAPPYEAGRTWWGDAWRLVLVKRGWKWTRVVSLDGFGIRVGRTKEQITMNPSLSITILALAPRWLKPDNPDLTITAGARTILKEALEWARTNKEIRP